jgi:hypothetical protein
LSLQRSHAETVTKMELGFGPHGFPPAPKTATVGRHRRPSSRLSPGNLVDNQPAPSASRGLLALALLWLSGASLRFTVLAVPPVVPLLHADLHLSETGIGWLSSLPPMLFAIAAVPGAMLIARSASCRRWSWACLSMPSAAPRAARSPMRCFFMPRPS